MNRLLDFDPLTGESVWFTDNHDGTLSITHQQHGMENIVENNKKLANERDDKKQIDKGWWHYATIPNWLVTKWTREIGDDILKKRNEKELLKRVNHPDYAYLRTTHGRHGV